MSDKAPESDFGVRHDNGGPLYKDEPKHPVVKGERAIEGGTVDYPGKYGPAKDQHIMRNDSDNAPAEQNGMPTRATQERNATEGGEINNGQKRVRDGQPGVNRSTYRSSYRGE